MFYITYNQPESYRQMTFEEMLAGIIPAAPQNKFSASSTRTRIVQQSDPSFEKIWARTDVVAMIANLKMFNQLHYDTYIAQIREFEAIPKDQRIFDYKIKSEFENIPNFAQDTERVAKAQQAYAAETARLDGKCYRTFKMRKKSNPRKFRTINAPSEGLSATLTQLKVLLDGMMIRSHHASAFAYVENRSTIDAVKKHQKWGSHWYSHFDFSDFFGSTTHDFLMSQFELIYPFNFIMADSLGRKELSKALELCFLDGGLPQGTPISPFLTNVMMIPFDHIVTNSLAEYTFPGTNHKERFVYTRYADDLTISARGTFDVKAIERFIISVLVQMNAPFSLNTEKTHYGSRAGSNWNLGLMVNKDNEITVGYRAKKELKRMLNSYILDRQRGDGWELDEIYALQGKISYFRSVEQSTIDYIINKMNVKYGVDVIADIKADIKNYTV